MVGRIFYYISNHLLYWQGRRSGIEEIYMDSFVLLEHFIGLGVLETRSEWLTVSN